MAEAKENSILGIFRDLRERQRKKFDIHQKDIGPAVKEIEEAYNPKILTENSKRILLDFNREDLRYAYLVKYPIHAAALQEFLSRNEEYITSVLGDRDTIKICCLGGGPGSDVIGFADEICKLPELSEKTYEFTVIDNMKGWEEVFNDLFKVADAEKHGNLGEFLTSERVSHFFIHDNLCSPAYQTLEEIGSADISVLLKFVSALDPHTAPDVLKKLFSCMKPGALVVFLDNSLGGSLPLASGAASECNFEPIGWFVDKTWFENRDFKDMRWGPNVVRYGIDVAKKIWINLENP